jgi:hypothetical protein
MKQEEEPVAFSRRNILTGSAVLFAGGAIGGVAAAFAASTRPRPVPPPGAPPLPWKWVSLDPLEAGRRAYRYYFEKGGCGSGSYMGLLSLLREKVGHPWTTLPDLMMSHATAGYGGHGTLCGALGGASLIINLVAYSEKDEMFRQLIDKLFFWYADQEFPTDRFDDISPVPNQVKARAMSPLCHVSISKWTLAAGARLTSMEKRERCAKVTGEIVYTVTSALNEYSAGKWMPHAWTPPKEIEHCVKCHGPDDMAHSKDGIGNQQGHMDCLLCHEDDTKVSLK